MDKIKYYEIEARYVDVMQYRYCSLYNGARGTWHCHREEAIDEGLAHKALIIALHMPEPTVIYKESDKK